MTSASLMQYPLSPNQRFLQLFDQGDEAGPFGPRYNLTYSCRVTGHIDATVLGAALNDVIERHSALRTVVIREAGGYQQVMPPSPAKLTVSDLRGAEAGEFDRLSDHFLLSVEEVDGNARPPLLRAELGLLSDTEAVLALVAHHTAADEWSMPLILHDLAEFYHARSSGETPALHPVAQFVEYSAWEAQRSGDSVTVQSREYWRAKLDGAVVSTLSTDHPRSAGLPKETAWDRFGIPSELSTAVSAIARASRATPFMVLLASYCVYLKEHTGQDDVVVMSFASGRTSGTYNDTVGSFFNFLPLRTDLTGCENFEEAVSRVRRTCLDAYRNELPFLQVLAEAPELMAAGAADTAAICAFQVFRAPVRTSFHRGPLTYRPVSGRQLRQESGGDVPDGAMWHLDLHENGELGGCVAYNTNLFAAARMDALVGGYLTTLTRVVENPAARL